MTKGILIVALGHANYGNMAFNLAVSLKNSDPEIPICLVYTKSAITHISGRDLERFFDIMTECPKAHYTTNGRPDYIKIKSRLYDITPFERTIFLDADQIMLTNRDINAYFNELEGVGMSMGNYGFKLLQDIRPGTDTGEMFWGNIDDVRKSYKLKEGKLYRANSSFTYFEKSPAVEKFFGTVKKIFDKPKVHHVVFAGSIPDELAYEIAFMVEKMYPHQDNYLPAYWPLFGGPIKQYFELKEYGFYNMAGNLPDDYMIKNYNNLVRWHFNKAGLSNPYLFIPKAKFLPERKEI